MGRAMAGQSGAYAVLRKSQAYFALQGRPNLRGQRPGVRTGCCEGRRRGA